jgi:hypothetical protein
MKKLAAAMEDARSEGFAVIGFAVSPEAGGLVKLDNQHMSREQFCAMLGESLNVFVNFTDADDTPKIILN